MPGELFDVVDESDNVVGRELGSVSLQKGLLHRAIATLLFDSHGRLYIQKRAGDMTFYPGHWSISCTGHVSAGETYSEAARREMKEELDLDCDLVEVTKFQTPKWDVGGLVEWEYIVVFEGHSENPEVSLSDETTEGKFVPLEEFKRLLRSLPEKFTPDSLLAFEHYTVAKAR
ncbi:MAG: NUDIX domain-containing protein [Thaumarchaeota archaeon]|nr:NUDIX domain-containing protein [Nitrososphaerota archaeon]